jgi:hypothetical protein
VRVPASERTGAIRTTDITTAYPAAGSGPLRGKAQPLRCARRALQQSIAMQP